MTLPRPTAQELIAKTQSSHKPHPYAEIQGIRPRGSTQMTLNTPVRSGAALVGIAGMAVLAGCSGAAEAEPQEPRDYADGTYTAEGSYQTPETLEQISVTVTLDDGVIADVEIVGDPQAAESRQFQGAFIGGIAEEVVGKPIDEVSVRRVAGSSLTSGAFNQALAAIKEQAAG